MILQSIYNNRAECPLHTKTLFGPNVHWSPSAKTLVFASCCLLRCCAFEYCTEACSPFLASDPPSPPSLSSSTPSTLHHPLHLASTLPSPAQTFSMLCCCLFAALLQKAAWFEPSLLNPFNLSRKKIMFEEN